MVLNTIEECRRTRIADMIYDRLFTCLAHNSGVPNGLEDNTQLVIQGRLCRPGSSDHFAVIELVILLDQVYIAFACSLILGYH